MQRYKFLDVGADELRGTFAAPAQSEQRLLYDAQAWRQGLPGRYALPQQVSSLL